MLTELKTFSYWPLLTHTAGTGAPSISLSELVDSVKRSDMPAGYRNRRN